MEKDQLPRYSAVDEFAAYPRSRRRRHGPPKVIKALILACIGYVSYTAWTTSRQRRHADVQLLSLERLQADLATCGKVHSTPHDPSGAREKSGRYVDGHSAVLIRNATVWTGEASAGTTPEEARLGKGYSWIQADVLLEHGLIKRVEASIHDSELPQETNIYNAHGRQLTAGIVDMHSHIGVSPLPGLVGSNDDNEMSNDITPYVRSIDGLNPLDEQIQVAKSGGVTTSLVLPGSGNNMGGEAFVIKTAVGKSDGRPELSVEDMLADPEHNWRYMKMACGENPKDVYGTAGRDFGPFSRLGEAWYFRHAFEQATAMVKAQDDWCSAAEQSGVENMQSYLPQDLKWESLGALLRGQVLLNTHCYTAHDIETFIRHTNEFKFKIRAFHHAHGAYLVPEVMKRAYGGQVPAAALFADFMYYKVESYTASEQAGKILWDNGITPVYVSDNPVINAQHVVFEAAKAYRNGLSYHVALAGVTSASAEILGLGNRIGKVKPGFDADIVVWDSDPLSVGAAPVQIWIDGTPQYEQPVELTKPAKEPLVPKNELQVPADREELLNDVVFRNISVDLYVSTKEKATSGDVVVRNGVISCVGKCDSEISTAEKEGVKVVNLHDGYLSPSSVAFGSTLGLVEIEMEEDAHDGANSDESFSRAIDGLTLDSKSLHAAYSHGVTRAISAPMYASGGFKGISVGFSTGALHSREKDAVWQDEVALHYSLVRSSKSPSLSGTVGALKRKLEKIASSETSASDGDEERGLKKVLAGNLPLVISVHSVDLIAALLRMKQDLEKKHSTTLRFVVLGGAESHLIADQLAEAKVGVVLAPALHYSQTWDQRRSLTGAPRTNGTAIDVLYAAGVKVCLSTDWNFQTRDLYLAAGIAFANGGGKISAIDALAMVSTNVYEMLDLPIRDENHGLEGFVVFEGHPLMIDSRVRAVADGRGKVSMWS